MSNSAFHTGEGNREGGIRGTQTTAKFYSVALCKWRANLLHLFSLEDTTWLFSQTGKQVNNTLFSGAVGRGIYFYYISVH